MNAEGTQGDPSALPGYAATRGMDPSVSGFALPKATQLMRHGFMQEARSVARGELPGLTACWLAQVSYVYEGRRGIERSPYTLVLAEAPGSAGFAVRVLCHDRGLDERDASNPDADGQIVELDDRDVRLESDRFLRRYALSTDHDQDQLSVWEVFDPGLIAWLTDEAPQGFSFELQDGALCCFVPGFLEAESELDALVAGAARVFSHVDAVRGERGTDRPPEPGSRDELLERELSAHPFDRPPESVKDAAKAFRRGLRLGDRARALGAEAFFRCNAEAAGFERIDPARFRANHLTTAFPGKLAKAASGSLAGADAFLLLADDENYDSTGWSVLLVELGSPLRSFSIAQSVPRGDATERGALFAFPEDGSLLLWTLDRGVEGRRADELSAFIEAARKLLETAG